MQLILSAARRFPCTASHASSQSAGRRAPYPGGVPPYQEEQGGGGGPLDSYSSAFQQDMGHPFSSGSFPRHKDTPLAPEHQWSLSSA